MDECGKSQRDTKLEAGNWRALSGAAGKFISSHVDLVHVPQRRTRRLAPPRGRSSFAHVLPLQIRVHNPCCNRNMYTGAVSSGRYAQAINSVRHLHNQ